MAETILVYPPNNGPAEKHTRANARDLVNGAGYSWQPGVATTPAGYAPFVTVKAPDSSIPSQTVLDSVGSSGNGGASAAATAAAVAQAAEAERIQAALAAQAAPAPVAAAPTEVVDFSKPAVDSADLDEETDADAEAEAEAEASAGETTSNDEGAPRRRGRPPRNA